MAITTTAQTLIKDALKLIGALAQGEEPQPGEYEDGYARLNELVDTWSSQRLTQPTITRTVVDLVANQVSYSVGDGGDIDIPRPEFVEDVRLIYTTPNPTNEVSLGALTDAGYRAEALKGLTATQPTRWYYQHTMPLGTLWLFPIPDNATNDVVIYTSAAFAPFTTQTASVTLPPAYARALRTNLAMMLAPEFGRPFDPAIDRMARDAMSELKALNVRMVDLVSPGSAGWYDIRSDTFR